MRKVKDKCLYGFTYGMSSISVIVFILILSFVFKNGFASLSWDLLTTHYWSDNYVGTLLKEGGHYQKNENLAHEAVWSERWGIGFIDVMHHDENQILVEAVHEESPFQVFQSQTNDTLIEVKPGLIAERMLGIKDDGDTAYLGRVTGQNANDLVQSLEEIKTLENVYFKTLGGGIKGSLHTTLLLIIITLLIMVPLGIGAAIYLHEYLKPSKTQRILRSMIEMLSGVPSIIYSLVGISLLFPLTKLAGASTTSILLGAMTLSMMLLPLMIRSSEEALMLVPQGLKEASLSLGASKTQTIFKVVLPYSYKYILNGILLCIARIIGESAALIYTMGTFVNDQPTILSQGTSLALHIYQIMSGETPNFTLACAIAIVILMIIFLLQVSVKMISYHQKKGA